MKSKEWREEGEKGRGKEEERGKKEVGEWEGGRGRREEGVGEWEGGRERKERRK